MKSDEYCLALGQEVLKVFDRLVRTDKEQPLAWEILHINNAHPNFDLELYVRRITTGNEPE
jgi:hypothetical protein